MNIVAILPTFNRIEQLKIIIKQILSQKLDKNVSLSIVVVVDGNIDNTFEILSKDFPEVHTVLGDGNLWYTKSMNLGFLYAQKFNPNYILTLNDDIEIHTDYISTLISDFVIQRNKNCILGSISISNDESKLIHFAGDLITGSGIFSYKPIISSLKIKYSKSIHNGIYECANLPGRGMFIPNDLLIKLKYFDQNLPQYGSDTDFCIRAKKMGIKILISWNAVIKANIGMTRVRSESNGESYFIFLKDLFNIHSHYSLQKYIYLVYKHSNPFLLLYKVPLYIVQCLYNIYKSN
jgi:GT2 family glycosyltransferase